MDHWVDSGQHRRETVAVTAETHKNFCHTWSRARLHAPAYTCEHMIAICSPVAAKGVLQEPRQLRVPVTQQIARQVCHAGGFECGDLAVSICRRALSTEMTSLIKVNTQEGHAKLNSVDENHL
jgi:hypothetical protein